MSTDKLTPRQQRFVEEYLKDLNSTRAARQVRYSEHTARAIGSENLTKPHIAAAIQAAMAARAERVQVTVDWVLQQLKRVYLRCMAEEPIYTAKGKPTGEYRFDSAGANRSLELIGKHLGMFKEKLEDPVSQDAVYLELMAIVRARIAACNANGSGNQAE